jgi:hypothetical protein
MTPSPVGSPKARLLENPPSAIFTTKYLFAGSLPFMNPDLIQASSSCLPVSSNGPRWITGATSTFWLVKSTKPCSIADRIDCTLLATLLI